jgi:hypothetical protein
MWRRTDKPDFGWRSASALRTGADQEKPLSPNARRTAAVAQELILSTSLKLTLAPRQPNYGEQDGENVRNNIDFHTSLG